jgi:Zn-dependent oligopeptidase
VPSQLFERLFTSPAKVAQLCLHADSAQPLPLHLADALASYYQQRYASPLALSARAAAGLAEQMYGQYGDEAAGCGIWRGSWELLSGLPAAVAAAGSLREVREG